MPDEDRRKFIQSIYLDATATIRHYDSARTTFAQMFTSLLSFLTAGLTVSISLGLSNSAATIMTSALVLLSLIALLTNAKFSALIALQRSRAAGAMALYDAETGTEEATACPVPVLTTINSEAKLSTKSLVGSKYSLSAMWTLIFLVVAMANIGLLAIVLVRP